MSNMMSYHPDYHIKPVWDGKDKKALEEILIFIKVMDIPQDKVLDFIISPVDSVDPYFIGIILIILGVGC